MLFRSQGEGQPPPPRALPLGAALGIVIWRWRTETVLVLDSDLVLFWREVGPVAIYDGWKLRGHLLTWEIIGILSRTGNDCSLVNRIQLWFVLSLAFGS